MNRYLTEPAAKKRAWEIPVGILSAFLGVIAVETWLEDSPADEESFFIWLLAYLAVVALMLLPLYAIVRRRLRQRQARAIAEKLYLRRESSIPLKDLDRVLGIRDSAARIADLKRRGFLQRLELDDSRLLLDDPEPQPAPEEAAEADGLIRRIRQLNDEIDDEAVSRRIDRLERATAGILQTIDRRPERAPEARRFMNYYLPTTLKLLESYRLMEDQSYQGENIRASRRRIEEVLEKLVAAAEKQQDRLFRSESLDVEAEISVLETMMASDGLYPR